MAALTQSTATTPVIAMRALVDLDDLCPSSEQVSTVDI